MNSDTVRYKVLELLDRMDKKAYSNLLLDKGISGLSIRDKAFASRLFYGVLERKLTLEYIISKYSSRPLAKLDGSVVNILKMGLYQLLYMDSVPDSAAVNESVALAGKCGKKSASGFINAVLRNFIRNGKQIEFPEDAIENLSVKYSCCSELVKLLCDDYSYERAENFLKNSLTPHKLYIRVNTLKTTAEKLIDDLEKTGINSEICADLPDCISVKDLGGIDQFELFKQGMFHVQDLSSQMCCRALSPRPGETVIDICAAPGGKSFTLAEIMENKGRIISGDIREKRVELIRKGAEKLGISIIEAVCNDAGKFNESFPKADKIICDVPCSGFGVIRSKPEIKYNGIERAKELPEVQYNILSSASSYLKDGGELVYSTCTLHKAENDDIIDRFLNEHHDFEPANVIVRGEDIREQYKFTVFPDEFDCEGFFISKIRKVGR